MSGVCIRFVLLRSYIYTDLLFILQVPIYIIAQTIGSLMATYIGGLVYGIKSDVMMTQPLQGCNSAFWVELIASFIIMFLVTALTSEPQSVSVSTN